MREREREERSEREKEGGEGVRRGERETERFCTKEVEKSRTSIKNKVLKFV